MANIVDTLYAYKFIRILSMKWEDMDAYKFGIIDEDGNPLKKSKDLETTEEKNSYNTFHRLVFKMKRMLEKIPGGKSAVARYSAAILLIKEETKEMGLCAGTLKSLEENLKKYLDKPVIEEEVTNVTGGIDGKPMPLGKDGVKKRKKPKVVEEEDEEEVKEYYYAMIGDNLVRIEEAGKRKKLKVRVLKGKKQRKKETDSRGKFTRTGNRKLRGAKLARKRRSLRKANRKAHTGSASMKRKRSKRKLKRYSH